MKKETYLNNMKTIFENNYSIKTRRIKEEEKQNKEKKKNVLQYVGELSLCLDEETFKKLHPSETNIEYEIHPSKNKNSAIELVNNGPKYFREINPYEKMVNMAMIDNKSNRVKFSFKANSFYQKAVEYSQKPQEAKMDSNNPIYAYIANPNEYRYYHYKR